MRVLFITANRIGDAVLATGVLRHLVAHYPTARFTIACGPVCVDLFRAVPQLDRLIVLKKEKRHGHWMKLWKTCVAHRWDLVVDLRNSLVSRLLWAGKRAYRPARATGNHKVLDNASALGLSPPPSPHLWLDEAAIRVAEGIIPPACLDTPLLAFGPAANWPAKQWPIENFIALYRRLVESGAPFADSCVMVLAAPHERDHVQALLDVIPDTKRIEVIGPDLLAVAACLKRARLFIGNDSGLMHMAAAVGTPTLGLFGPSLETIYGPWGDHAQPIRTPESMAELVRKLPYPGAFAPNLMETLQMENVYQTAVSLYQRTDTI